MNPHPIPFALKRMSRVDQCVLVPVPGFVRGYWLRRRRWRRRALAASSCGLLCLYTTAGANSQSSTLFGPKKWFQNRNSIDCGVLGVGHAVPEGHVDGAVHVVRALEGKYTQTCVRDAHRQHMESSVDNPRNKHKIEKSKIKKQNRIFKPVTYHASTAHCASSTSKINEFDRSRRGVSSSSSQSASNTKSREHENQRNLCPLAAAAGARATL